MICGSLRGSNDAEHVAGNIMNSAKRRKSGNQQLAFIFRFPLQRITSGVVQRKQALNRAVHQIPEMRLEDLNPRQFLRLAYEVVAAPRQSLYVWRSCAWSQFSSFLSLRRSRRFSFPK